MSVTAVEATPELRVVSEPVVGLLPDPPEWVTEAGITDEERDWLKARWNPTDRVMLFTSDELAKESDSSMTEAGKHRLRLHDLPGRVVSEIFIQLMADHQNGLKMYRKGLTLVVRQCRSQQVTSTLDLDRDESFGGDYLRVVNRWLNRPWFATAEEEWERGRAGAVRVRAAVVSPNPKHRKNGMTFNFPAIAQTWLRHLTADVINYNLTTGIGLKQCERSVTAAEIISKVIGQRRDGGNNPSTLTRQDMRNVATWVKGQDRWKPSTQESHLKAVSALLATAQSQGMAATYNVPAVFQISFREDMPQTATKQFQEKGFNNALFTLLVGEVPLQADTDGVIVDWGFGSRTLDFAASIPSEDFQGALFVNGIRMGGNFGRRPTELLELPCDRVSQDDRGRYCLIYDDFKNNIDAIPLPIDSAAAEHIINWQKQVQAHYPHTATGDLKLFPRSNRNPNGTAAISVQFWAEWWAIYVLGLEQAIVMGKLWHAAHTTDPTVTIEQVAALTCEAITPTGIRINKKVVKLDSDTLRMLTDYTTDLHTRLTRNGLYREMAEGDRPLFPHPTSQRKTGVRYVSFVGSAPVDFYNALGNKWWERAADYKSHGLPATHFGEGRTNPRKVTFNKMRHTYLQQLVNCGTDIFIVSQLAGHNSVSTTVDNYVSAPQDALVEAAERLAKFRSGYLNQQHITNTVWLGAVGRNTSKATQGCLNGDVHAVGMRGCSNDELCADCNDSFYDPSHLPKIKAEIAQIRSTLNAVTEPKPGQLDYLTYRLERWQQRAEEIHAALAQLPDEERYDVLAAAEIMIGFRDRQFNDSGIHFGIGVTTPTTT